ncbi:hypothetical protein H5410_063367 [Solanum commersonii]|uniref:Uncharacterized protein n=1 Tax=Solanum commersonii TaxID=4109 RepID=A0A9J5WD29_SOLCO|nr:hypothetical protein H5410_063367 [Solanum commersonii]
MVLNHFKFQAWSEFKAKFRRRVSAYVVDWTKELNPRSNDRTPGLGFSAVEPKDWPSKFYEVYDNGLKDLTWRWFGLNTTSIFFFATLYHLYLLDYISSVSSFSVDNNYLRLSDPPPSPLPPPKITTITISSPPPPPKIAITISSKKPNNLGRFPLLFMQGSSIFRSGLCSSASSQRELAGDCHEDIVLFVKGVNNRQGINREPNEFNCIFSYEGNKVIRTKVTSSIQEVFRCNHPDPTVMEGEGVSISLEILLPVPMVVPFVAYYNAPRKLTTNKKSEKARLCACTMVYNVGKFLKEWVLYHFQH